MQFDRSKYPDFPGVYLMKDGNGTVIYVGKASSLRTRLSQHFQSHTHKPIDMVQSINTIEFVITKTPNEALILESNMIKSYQPKYNLLLKDGRHYSYLAITDEKFPRLIVARKNSSGRFRVKGAKFYGPFVEGSKRAISARYLRKLFKIRICNKLPKRECLQYHLGNCDAPCINKISEQEYQENIDALDCVLNGKNAAKTIMEELRGRMETYSSALEYERAAAVRDQIESLKIFFERQNVERNRSSDEDFLWFHRIGGNIHVQILKSRSGVIGKTDRHCVPINEQEDPELSFCLQYYDPKLERIPDKIYSNLPEKELELLNSIFNLPLFIKPGSEKSKVLELARSSLVYSEIDSSVIKLKEELSLKREPVVIETFDISTLFGENSVASMVQFVNGKPNKSGYRRFMIKTVEGQDDFSMMNEVVYRRYSRLLKEGSTFPDLILIDGGIGQLHAAINALEEAGVQIPIAALAKQEEEIYLPSSMKPIRLQRSNPALKLLQCCRDEAHRFAVTYQRLKRGKKMKE